MFMIPDGSNDVDDLHISILKLMSGIAIEFEPTDCNEVMYVYISSTDDTLSHLDQIDNDVQG